VGERSHNISHRPKLRSARATREIGLWKENAAAPQTPIRGAMSRFPQFATRKRQLVRFVRRLSEKIRELADMTDGDPPPAATVDDMARLLLE
jgi:hypothetical protein